MIDIHNLPPYQPGAFDNSQALNEGWDLFDVDGRLQLLMLDDPGACDGLDYTEPKFQSDVAALLFVAQQALEGSRYHLYALDRIGTTS
jgi:hypothetical protein